MQEKNKTKKTSSFKKAPQKKLKQTSKKDVTNKSVASKRNLARGRKNLKHTLPSKTSIKGLPLNNTTYLNKTSIISLIILFLTLFAGYFLYSLNDYVKDTFDISSKGNTKIYTDIIKINTLKILPKNILKDFLKKLNYVEVQSIPKDEGEFFESTHDNLDAIYLFRRNISKGKLDYPKELYVLNYKDNKVTCTLNKDCNDFILEPLPITSSKNSKDKFEYKKLNTFNKELIKTVTTVEDKRFYKHFGIDLKGIFRALYVNVINWKTKQGASTITQQLVKNLFLTNERKLKRKLKEAFLSIYIELFYTKDEILEKYLNSVYLGQDKNTAIKGFSEASKFYFNKDINKLSISEISLLVGMIKAPSSYSPILNYKKALERKDVVLKMLYDENVIDKKTYLEESLKEIRLNVRRINETSDNYFYDALTSSILLDVKKKEQGKISSISTKLNPLFQMCAKDAINLKLSEIQSTYKNLKNIEASLITLDSQTGLTLAYIGGSDYTKSQFDRVRLSKRQIGSLIKPFIYLAALDPNLNSYKQATPLSILDDKPIVLYDANKRKWAPQNFDKKFRGLVTLREALEKSLNVPTVNLAQKVGLKTIISTLNKVGIKNLSDKTLAISLGAVDLSLFDITSAYTTFSNDGHYVEGRFYSEVFDKDDNIIRKSYINENDVSSKEATFVLNTILNGVFLNGTAKSANELGKNLNFAGKTGTSNSQRDNWFIGFNKKYVTGIWVGLDDNKKLPFTGSTSSLPIFKEYISCISKYTQDEPFIKPQNVKEVYINKFTFDKCSDDVLTTSDEGTCYKEYFINDTGIANSINESSKKAKELSRDRSFFEIVND